MPPLDKENNYVLTGFEESDDKTVLKFNRKFDTCDPKDKKIEVRQVFIEKNRINRNYFFALTVGLLKKVIFRFRPA